MAKFNRGSCPQKKTEKSERWITTNTSREHSLLKFVIPALALSLPGRRKRDPVAHLWIPACAVMTTCPFVSACSCTQRLDYGGRIALENTQQGACRTGRLGAVLFPVLKGAL